MPDENDELALGRRVEASLDLFIERTEEQRGSHSLRQEESHIFHLLETSLESVEEGSLDVFLEKEVDHLEGS